MVFTVFVCVWTQKMSSLRNEERLQSLLSIMSDEENNNLFIPHKQKCYEEL